MFPDTVSPGPMHRFFRPFADRCSTTFLWVLWGLSMWSLILIIVVGMMTGCVLSAWYPNDVVNSIIEAMSPYGMAWAVLMFAAHALVFKPAVECKIGACLTRAGDIPFDKGEPLEA
jgi:hypothetical protein